jgi:hypothetical protein
VTGPTIFLVARAEDFRSASSLKIFVYFFVSVIGPHNFFGVARAKDFRSASALKIFVFPPSVTPGVAHHHYYHPYLLTKYLQHALSLWFLSSTATT